MKVLLVSVPLMDKDTDGTLRPLMMDQTRDMPPLAVYLLAQIMRNEGHDVAILDLIAAGAIDESLVVSRFSEYELVGISVNSLNWPTARHVIETARRSGVNTPIVLGGVHATLFDEHLLRHFPIDFVIRGEGERGLPALARFLSGKAPRSEVAGLSHLDANDCLVRNDAAPPLSTRELDDLPAPAYDLLPDGVYHGLSIESSRGCRFSCAFCSIPYRKSWRPCSPTAFVKAAERLEPFLKRVQQRSFHVVDDCFTLDQDRVVEIVRLFERSSLDFQGALDARCSDIKTLRFARILNRITKVMLLGAESGHDFGLRRIKKGITVEMIERSATLLHEAGLAERCVYSFILGLPWEKYDDVLKTVSFAASLTTRFNVTLYLQWHSLMPGSSIWNGYADAGELSIGHYDEFGYFTNKHLAGKAISLNQDEALRMSEKIEDMKRLFNAIDAANGNRRQRIQFSVPPTLIRSRVTGSQSALESVSA